MKRLWRSFFLTRRSFTIGWMLVALLIIAYLVPPVWKPALIVLMSMGVITALDLAQLYRVRNGIGAKRETLAKWSNGDENPVTIHLRSRYRIPLKVTILDELPPELQERELKLQLDLAPRGVGQTTYMVRPLTRGVYRYGAINVLVRTRLGLGQRRYRLEAGREIAVYPSYIHLHQYELRARADLFSQSGARRVRRVAERSEFEHIREYMQGDDRRNVNWKATARRARLMVNQYQDEKAQQVVALIDTGRTMKMPFGGLTLLERAINATLMLAHIALKKDDQVGVITYSNRVHHVLQPSRRRGQMHQVLELLYALDTDHAETDVEALYARVRRTVTRRSLLLVFTNYESLQAMRRQLPYLRLLAHTYLVAVVIFRNTELDNMVRQPDKSTMDVYVKTITTKLIHEKVRIVQELDRHGILTILTPPEELSLNVLNKYLEIKARGLL